MHKTTAAHTATTWIASLATVLSLTGCNEKTYSPPQNPSNSDNTSTYSSKPIAVPSLHVPTPVFVAPKSKMQSESLQTKTTQPKYTPPVYTPPTAEEIQRSSIKQAAELAAKTAQEDAEAKDFPHRTHLQQETCRTLLEEETQKLQSTEIPLGLGSDFVEVQEDSTARYLGDRHSSYKKWSPFYDDRTDAEEHPLIPSQQAHLLPASASPYSHYFRQLSELPHSTIYAPWAPEHHTQPTVQGFSFAGYGIKPEEIKIHGGLLPRFLQPDTDSPHQTRCEAKKDMGLGFLHLWAHIVNSKEQGAYWSTSRSIRVARDFARGSNPEMVSEYNGSNPKPTEAPSAYVYMIYVQGAIDARTLTQTSGSNRAGEQELLQPGSLLWSHIVGYRKLRLQTKMPFNRTDQQSHPAEFTGPIHVRQGLQDREPEAYAKLVHSFSLKSGQTESALEKGHY